MQVGAIAAGRSGGEAWVHRATNAAPSLARDVVYRLPPARALMPEARAPLVLADVGIGSATRKGPPPLQVALPPDVRERLWHIGLDIDEHDGQISLTSSVRGMDFGMGQEIARFGPAAGRRVTATVAGPANIRLRIAGGKAPITLDIDTAARRVTSSTGTQVSFGYTSLELIAMHSQLLDGNTSGGASLRAHPRAAYPVLVQLFGDGPDLPYVSVRGELAGGTLGLTLGVTPRDGGSDVAAFIPEGSEPATLANEMAHLLWRAMDVELAAACGPAPRADLLEAMERGDWFSEFRWPLAGFTYDRLDKQMADELISDVASIHTDSEDILRIAGHGGMHPGHYGATVALMLALIRDINSRRTGGRRIPDATLEGILFGALSPAALKAALALDEREIGEIRAGYLRAGQALLAHYRSAVRCASLRER